MPPDRWDALADALRVQRQLGVRAVVAAVGVKLEKRINEAIIKLDAPILADPD